MKRVVFATLLLAFSGVSFAETPKIVNPPRPQKNYKWLLFIEHRIEYLGYTFRTVPLHKHFIYSNNYKVSHNAWLTITGPYEEYPNSINKSCRLYESEEEKMASLMLSVNEEKGPQSFLVAKAPRSLVVSKFSPELLFQPAQVVFTK